MVNENAIMSAEEAKKARRRYDCKINQRRYRERKRILCASIQKQTDQVMHTIRNREMEKVHLVRGIQEISTFRSDTAFRVVDEYLSVFRNGLQNERMVERREQINFLNAVVHPAISLGEMQGRNALVQQWDLFSSLYDNFTMTNSIIDISSAKHLIVYTKNKLQVMITDRALQYLYPNISAQQQYKNLVGTPLELDIVLEFKFDEQMKVIGLGVVINMLQAWANKLGSAKQAHSIVQSANMFDNGLIMNHKRSHDIVEYSACSNDTVEYSACSNNHFPASCSRKVNATTSTQHQIAHILN